MTLEFLSSPKAKKDFSSAAPCERSTSIEQQFDQSGSMSQRTDAVLRGLLLVLKHHGAKQTICELLEQQLHEYLDTSGSEAVWLKRSKYVLAYPLAKYLRNEVPPQPDLVFKPTGSLRAWMKQRLVCFNRKNSHLWFSWFQAKRAAMPLSDDLIEATYKKHLETLTREDPGKDERIKEILSNKSFAAVLKRVRTSFSEAYKDDFTLRTPSGSACFESTRSKEGQYGALRRFVKLPDFIASDELLAMRVDHCVVYSRHRSYNLVSEIRCPYGYLEWFSLRESLPDLIMEMTGRLPNATIQGILEPFKVRVISKGESLPYYFCKPIQLALIGALQKQPCFRLCGRPMCPTDFMDLKKKSEKTDLWFSVDYSAATDGLSYKYSGQILQYVLQDLPWEYRLLARRVLGPHNLHYPIKKGTGFGPCTEFLGVQRNGQLMGSILSFPILCLANLGVYLTTTENHQRGWTLNERLNHVLVNGDDMVYSAPKRLWERHVQIAKDVGLEMSVGKAYQHPVYANINSTSVHLDLRSDTSTPWQIDYLNSGLFFGQHKVQEKEPSQRNETGDSLSSRHPEDVLIELFRRANMEPQEIELTLLSPLNWILQGTLPGLQGDILKQYLALHGERIRIEQTCLTRIGRKMSLFSRNLFLPIGLGGMGINRPLGFKNDLKPIQIHVARSLLEQYPGMGHSTMHPLPNVPVTPLDSDPNVPWVRKLVHPELVERKVSRMEYGLSSKKRESLYAHQNILFRVDSFATCA